MSYQLTEYGVVRLADGANIPNVPGNRDFLEYQEWLAAGNTPLAAVTLAPYSSDYLAFWDALLINPVYQEIRSQAINNPGVLVACTEFVAAISDAKAGRPNVPAIQACISNLLAAGSFSAQDLQALSDLLVIGNLQDQFTLTN